MTQVTRTRIQAKEYFESPEYQQHDLIQLIDGEVVITMPPILKHQRIVREILILLTLLARKIGGEALSSPIEVYLDEENIYEPDVLYLAPQTQCDPQEKRIIGAPELVVEVLSPSTAKHDRQTKYESYQQHGVREYWIVDPVHQTVEVWFWVEGQFERQGAFADEDTFRSSVLATDIEVKAIFDE